MKKQLQDRQVLVCKVTDAHGTYTARCNGKTASCTMGEDAALRRIGRKVFGHDNTQAYEVGQIENVTTWLLREKPAGKMKSSEQRNRQKQDRNRTKAEQQQKGRAV